MVAVCAFLVPRAGIEPATPGFLVPYSTAELPRYIARQACSVHASVGRNIFPLGQALIWPSPAGKGYRRVHALSLPYNGVRVPSHPLRGSSPNGRALRRGRGLRGQLKASVDLGLRQGRRLEYRLVWRAAGFEPAQRIYLALPQSRPPCNKAQFFDKDRITPHPFSTFSLSAPLSGDTRRFA